MKRELEIYRESFGISEDFEALLFKTIPETLKINNKTVSQLFLLPCNIVKDGIKTPCNYIFAAATKKEERQKGYMERLFRSVTKKGVFILRPASEKLIAYYKKLGFTLYSANDRENNGFYVEPLDGFKALADFEGKTADISFPLMAINCSFNLNGIYFPYTFP